MAEHQQVQAFTECAQQRHQHPVARIAFTREARPGVVNHGMTRRAHDHGIALPNVCAQQFKFTSSRPKRLPEQHWQQQRQPEQLEVPRQPNG